MKNYPKVSIVFPNYNGHKEPLDCLASIIKLNYPKSKLEIIVVDNGSKDGSDKQIKRKFPQVHLWKMKTNLGFAKAINFGIGKARGEYLFIGNDDLVFERNSLKVMTEYLLNNPDVGLVGGKIYYKYNPEKIASSGYIMNKWTGNIYLASNPEEIKEPDWVQGCALLIKKTVLNKTGYFNPLYDHLFEDYDLCIRVRKAGYKVVYLPHAIFWHAEGYTANKNIKLKYYYWYKSKFFLIMKNFYLINILSIFLVQILFITPYRALILHDGRFFPFLKAIYWHIKNLPLTLKERKI